MSIYKTLARQIQQYVDGEKAITIMEDELQQAKKQQDELGKEIADKKRKLPRSDDAFIKRQCVYEKTDKHLSRCNLSKAQYAKKHLWRWVNDADECYRPHCLEDDCYYKQYSYRMQRYNGYYECKLDDSIYYCDTCFNFDEDEAMNVLDESRPNACSITNNEAGQLADTETDVERIERMKNPDEWRHLISIQNCPCQANDGCDNDAVYFLKGSNTMLCEVHYRKTIVPV